MFADTLQYYWANFQGWSKSRLDIALYNNKIYIFLSSTQPRCHNYSLWKHRQFTILWLSVSVICSRCYSNPIICTRLPHATDGRTVGHCIITQTLPHTMQAVSSITDAATTEPVLNNASKVLRENACHTDISLLTEVFILFLLLLVLI